MPVPVVPELLRAKVKVFVDLYRKTRQLERFNAELEQRVSERTAALRSFNEELEQRIEERTREREIALAQLFEAQKMDTIGRLTGGVAHDFNNLLMAVLGSLSLLEKRLPDDAQCRRLLQNAVLGAQRGAALTQRLLAFSRRQELKPEAVDLSELVSGMGELLKRALGLSIELVCKFPSTLSPVLVDSNQLELALLNLALNARDAMPGGGTLDLAADDETIEEGSDRPHSRPEITCASASAIPAWAWTSRRSPRQPTLSSRPRVRAKGPASACPWCTGLPPSQGACCASRAPRMWARRSSCGCRAPRLMRSRCSAIWSARPPPCRKPAGF